MPMTAVQIRVLVADDDPIQRNLVGMHLAALNGVMVEAEDGAVAWDLLTSQSFDLAIVDLGMPNLDGIALIECMRGHPRTRHLPIIVMTSRADQQAIRDAFAAGASSFLIKPVAWATFEHLVGFLQRLVQAERRARADCNRATAHGRANETLLRNLAEETNAAISLIRAEMEQLVSMGRASAVPALFAEQLDRINDHCLVLQNYTRRITTAMQMLGDTIVVDSRRHDLSEMIGRLMPTMRAKAESAGVQIELQERAAASISCDADAIELALSYLMDNAVSNSPVGDKVSVSLEVFPDGVLAIEIIDRGAGTHPDDIGRLLPAAHSGVPDGTVTQAGLELLIAQAIAEAHSGKLEIRSMVGQGTAVLFMLPPDRVLVQAIAA